VRIGVLSDTHDQLRRTQFAVERLVSAGAEVLVHCGDIVGPDVLATCAVKPLYFAFGNHDSDMVHILQEAATSLGAHCLEWGGQFEIGEKRIAVAHGHRSMDFRPLMESEPHYLLTGHTHLRCDWLDLRTRRINPGSLHEAEKFSVALLDVAEDELRFLDIPADAGA
jgi:hypothetical protein